MDKLSTLIIGNRKTDPLLDIVDDHIAMARFETLDSKTFEDKCENPGSFLTDLRTLQFLEMRGLVHHSSPHHYKITNGYRHALKLIEIQKEETHKPFDTTFIYRLVDANSTDYVGMTYSQIDDDLSTKLNAKKIVAESKGIVVLLTKKEEELDTKKEEELESNSPIELYKYKIVQELKKSRRSKLIISYAMQFEDVIALNNDIGKNPAEYKQQRKPLEIFSREDFLNKDIK